MQPNRTNNFLQINGLHKKLLHVCNIRYNKEKPLKFRSKIKLDLGFVHILSSGSIIHLVIYISIVFILGENTLI